MVLHPSSGMRVLMTTDAVGGIWNYCLSLAGALQKYGIEVSLATMGPAPSDRQREEVRRLSNTQLYESTFKLEWMQDPWEDVARAGEWLLSLEQRLHPNIVHLNSYAHAALSWSSPVLVVAHSSVDAWFQAVRKCPPTAEWDEYMRRVAQGLSRADLVTAPTRASLEMLSRHYGPFKSVAPIYNGCGPARRSAAETEQIVLSVGRLWDPATGIAVLDQAAEDIHWPVYAAGATNGPDGQRIHLGNAQGLGCLDQRTLQRWYQRASIFVLPSLYEPFGLAALEAALSGCALVVSDIPTLREIWSDAAVFVSPEDHEALAQAINRLIDDAQLRREYAQRACQKARTYTLRRMADRYYGVYLSLIRKMGTPAGTAVDNPLPSQIAATGAG